jgi:hypothetical protein
LPTAAEPPSDGEACRRLLLCRAGAGERRRGPATRPRAADCGHALGDAVVGRRLRLGGLELAVPRDGDRQDLRERIEGAGALHAVVGRALAQCRARVALGGLAGEDDRRQRAAAAG